MIQSSSFKRFSALENMKTNHFWFIVTLLTVLIISVSVVLSEILRNDGVRVSKTKLILDVDAGVDDAIAILYLLRVQKYLQEHGNENSLEILGITCVRGNTHVDRVAINVLRTLKVVDRLDIPVYKGASQSILTSPPLNYYFGEDGFGDVPDPDPPSSSLIQKDHAVNTLVNLVNEYPGEVTILCLGPLTNIALAIRLDENFLKKVKNVVVLGGCVEGRGNILPGVEYNFYVDPEAVHIVLNGTNFDPAVITLVPWESILKSPITWKWRKEELGSLTSPEMMFLNEIEHIHDHADEEEWQMGDPLAAVLVINEYIATKKANYGITTVISGLIRGSTAVDYENFLNSHNKIEIIFDVDKEAFKSILLSYLS